jgi:hypothetical protein
VRGAVGVGECGGGPELAVGVGIRDRPRIQLIEKKNKARAASNASL